jgi:hypothetical protein
MIKLWIDTGKKHTYMTTSLAEKQFHYDNNPKKGSGKEYNGIFVFLIFVIQIKVERDDWDKVLFCVLHEVTSLVLDISKSLPVLQ